MDEDANTTLWLEAIRTRSYEEARKILHDDQDVNVRGVGGVTAFHAVASYNNNSVKKVEKLLLDGRSAAHENGLTPLRIAQRRNLTGVVQNLIFFEELLRALEKRLNRMPVLEDVITTLRDEKMDRFRGEVRLQMEATTTKFVSAARNGDFATVKSMLDSNEITIDAVDKATGETAFSAALATHRRRVCEYLLANGAHLYAPCAYEGNRRQSGLATAAETRDVDFVRRLVACGAELDESQFDIHTSPLLEAVKFGCMEMSDALLELGDRADIRSYGTHLRWPAGEVFVFPRTNLDMTPWWLLAIACWQEDTQMTDHLFKTQAVLADRSMLAKHGVRALVLATCQRNESIVMDLLERGVPINGSVCKGVTAVLQPWLWTRSTCYKFLSTEGPT